LEEPAGDITKIETASIQTMIYYLQDFHAQTFSIIGLGKGLMILVVRFFLK
jgi:hypothetical protein